MYVLNNKQWPNTDRKRTHNSFKYCVDLSWIPKIFTKVPKFQATLDRKNFEHKRVIGLEKKFVSCNGPKK